jgi:hypothetical protein
LESSDLALEGGHAALLSIDGSKGTFEPFHPALECRPLKRQLLLASLDREPLTLDGDLILG